VNPPLIDLRGGLEHAALQIIAALGILPLSGSRAQRR